MKLHSPGKRLILAVLLTGLAVPATSLACGMKAACRNDVEALCPDAESRREVRRCLRDHEDELSAVCREKLQQVREHHAAVREACQPDVEALCPDVESHREVGLCLHQHEAQLSDACHVALDAFHSKRCGRQR